MKKEALFILLLLLPIIAFSQTSKYIVVQSEEEEKVQDLAKVYEVEADSIKSWNNLNTNIIPAGTKIGIFNYNEISKEKIRINQIDIRLQNIDSQLDSINNDYQTAFNKLEKQKTEVDANSPYAMQEYLDISKAKYDLKSEKIRVEDLLNREKTQLKNERRLLQLKIDETKQTNIENEPTTIAEEISLANTKKKNNKEEKTNKPVEEKKKQKEPKTETKKADKASSNEGYNLEYLDFSSEAIAKTDTTSKKYKKEQAKLAKTIKIEETNDDFDKTVMIEEVEVSYKKKKTKYKIGDQVDAIRQDKAKFYLSRAMLEIDKGNLKKANAYINKSIELNPSYTEAYMLNGDLWASLGYFDKALKEYERASIVNGRIPQIFYNMGNCYIFLNKKDKAIEMMSLALDVDPNYVLAYSGRSSLYIENKEFKNALNDYESLLEINKYFYPALKGKGIANYELGNYDQAIIDFNKLLEYEDTDPGIYYFRGMAKVLKGDVYASCMDFLKATERGYKEADKAIKKYCD